MSATKTAQIIGQPLAIDKMPEGEIIWKLMKRPRVQVWILSVYSLTTTYLLMQPTILKVLHFFGA